MLDMVWLIPALPLAGFLVLALSSRRIGRTAAAIIGVGSSALSAGLAVPLGISFLRNPPSDNAFTQVLGSWIRVGSFAPEFTLRLDALSVTMVLVVTVVAFFIHLYSAEFMADDKSYARFFAYMNLFLASMLILLLADNLLFLYLGWEGVGLCSYLLIGFWYEERENARAAIKAFLVTRIGDVGMAVGLFLLFFSLGSLQIQEVMQRASQQWMVGSPIAIAAAALLLSGALGKSAQLPLQTWLPDAMAGPTPVSALIHAATMVTAGVYLIARTHVLFTLAPPVQFAVAVIGASTLLIAGCSALTQWDIKRVLAYSTISQIGYMFLALGVGAWSAGIFHFASHAFFKSLLFLGAGAILYSAGHERNMMKLGGLRKKLPVTFWTFLIGASSLAAVPLITGGFYSKEMILGATWSSPLGSKWLWFAGFLGTIITGIYAFRMVILTFFGRVKTSVTRKPGLVMAIPLVVLAVGSIGVGFLQMPENLGGNSMVSTFLKSVLPPLPEKHTGISAEAALEIVEAVGCLAGIFIAILIYYVRPSTAENITEHSLTGALHRFWFAGWGFDYLYDRVLVRPFVHIAQLNRNDVVDLIYQAIAWLNREAHYGLSFTQTGRLWQYAAGIVLGIIIAVSIVVFS